MSGGVTRFLGDSPLRVLMKLIVVSLLVGMVLAFLNWSPWDVYDWFAETLHAIWYFTFTTFDRFTSYLLLGAAIVVPVFLILRLISYRR
jgi:hypothetical protein